jgi:hypothetical protein
LSFALEKTSIGGRELEKLAGVQLGLLGDAARHDQDPLSPQGEPDRRPQGWISPPKG